MASLIPQPSAAENENKEEAQEALRLAEEEAKKALETKKVTELAKNMPIGLYGDNTIDMCSMVPAAIRNPDTGKGRIAYLTYGRYQPGHIGHRSLFEAMLNEAKESRGDNHFKNHHDNQIGSGTNVFVFASSTGGSEWGISQTQKMRAKNPLAPGDKVDLLLQQNFDLPIFFINSLLIPIPTKSIVGAIKLLSVCYDKVAVRLGSDQVPHFQWLKNTSVADLIHSIQSPPDVAKRDPTKEGISGLSSSKVRKAALEGNRDAVAAAIQINQVTDTRVDDIIEKIKVAAGLKGGNIPIPFRKIPFRKIPFRKRYTKKRTKKRIKKRKPFRKRYTKKRTKRRIPFRKRYTKKRIKRRKK